MNELVIFQLWRYKFPSAAALGTMLFVFLWPSIPLRGITNWLEFFYYYTPQNYLYAAMTILAGLYVGVYVYDKKVCRTCSVENAKIGTTGIIGGILLGACPACIPVLAIFLPLSLTIYLSYLSWAFIIVAIMLLSFLIWRMNGFKKI
ncbi:MAG: hypothetical protein HY445_01440 [Candidatus Niyogibacteria bacterium]|nr:hypothetical protein [Candidatus Niyogibacteria bacterium]